MICRCFGQSFDLADIARRAAAAADAMVGLPDYDIYAAHMASTHPEGKLMTREDFFRERQATRYGAGRMRCC